MDGFNKVCVIKGVAFFADKIDGQDVNVGSIFIEEQLDESKGNAKGFRTVEYRAESAEVCKAILGHEYPVTGEVSFRMQVGKRTHQIIVMGVKVTAPARPQPRAA